MRIYQRGQNWCVDFYHDGKRTRKKVGSKKDAENALAAVKIDILRGEYRFKSESKIRFEDFAERYLEYGKINKKKSWTRDRWSIENLKSCFNGMLFSKITPLHIEDYKKKRLEKVKGATVNRELACMKTMFNLAKKWKIVYENPVTEVKFLAEQKFEMQILNKEKADKLIDAAPDYLKPIIIIALNTGMRRGEILSLRWNDIDFDKHYIFIKETKSGIPRKVPMNSLVASTFKNIKREDRLIFYNPKTNNHLKDIYRSFKTACQKVGIPDMRFHDLRHTAATLMVTGGVDLVTVKEILGHSKIEMTMRYAHPTSENKRRAVAVLESIFSRKDGTNVAQTEKSIEVKEPSASQLYGVEVSKL